MEFSVVQKYYNLSRLEYSSILLLYYIKIKASFEKQNIFDLIFIGLLLSFLILLRRYYAYWVVSFFIAIPIEMLILNKFEMKNFWNLTKNIFTIGIVFVISFFVIATPIAKKMLFTNYADIYSAYEFHGSTLQIIYYYSNYFGAIFLVLFTTGFIYSILNEKRRSFYMFLLIQFIITFLLFSQVQVFYSHHYYLIISTMIIFMSIFIADIFSKIHNNKNKSVFLILFIIILLINFSVVFIPEASGGGFKKFNFMFSGSRWYPLERNDLNELNNLSNVLKNNILMNENDSVYVLSSSIIFNDDILRNVYHEKKDVTYKKILGTNHIDKRDGFPSQFLSAKYVIIATPIQYHVRPEDQRVIGIIAEQILNQSNNISHSYKKLPYKFTLDNNVDVFIYENVKQFKKSDLYALSQLFIEYYPNNKDIFTIKE